MTMKEVSGERYLEKIEKLMESEFPEDKPTDPMIVDFFSKKSLQAEASITSGSSSKVSAYCATFGAPPSRSALTAIHRRLRQADDSEETARRIHLLEHHLLHRLAGLLGYSRHDVSGSFFLDYSPAQWYGHLLATGTASPGKRDSRVLISTNVSRLRSTTLPLYGINHCDTALVPAKADGSLDLERLCGFLENCYRRDIRVDGIVLTLGQRHTGASDPVTEVQQEALRLRLQYGVLDRPHIHLDIPLHWPLLLFREYDFSTNPLELPPALLETIQKSICAITDTAASDSCSIDLGSWGYTPMSLSLLIVKNHKDLLPLLPTAAVPKLERAQVEAGHTGAPHASADTARLCSLEGIFASLSGLGEDGMRLLAARSIEGSNYLKERLRECGNIRVLHPTAVGPVVSFRRYHPDLGNSADEIFRAETHSARQGDTAPLKANSRRHQRQFAQQGFHGLGSAWQAAAAHLLNEPAQCAEPLPAETTALLHPRLNGAHIDLFVQRLMDRRRAAEPPAPVY